MPRRCAWCNGARGELREVTLPMRGGVGSDATPQPVLVHPEHEADLARFHAYVQRFAGWFLALLFGIPFGMLMLSMLQVPRAESIGMMSLGLVVIVFPFTTPQTTAMMGIRSAVRFGRALGVVCIGIGVLMFLGGM